MSFNSVDFYAAKLNYLNGPNWVSQNTTSSYDTYYAMSALCSTSCGYGSSNSSSRPSGSSYSRTFSRSDGISVPDQWTSIGRF